MKRKINTLAIASLLMLLFLQCTGCDPKNPQIDGEENTVAFDPRFVDGNKVGREEGQIFVNITTSHRWDLSVASDDNFVTVDVTSGQGNSSVTLFIRRNDGTERKAEIKVVFANGVQKSLTLIQRKGDEPAPDPSVASRLEIPKLSGDTDSRFIAHYAHTTKGKEVMNYCLEFVLSKHQSRWVAFRFDDDTRPKKVKRQDTWSDDPKLEGLTAMGTYPRFNGIGMDRGHMVASSDRLYSKEANDQTFYYSNIAPQIGEKFNQYTWQELEQRVSDWGRRSDFSDTLYVVKGITIDKDSDIIGYITSKGNKVTVPVAKKWYMALLKIKNGKYSAIGFVLDHKEYDSRTILPAYRRTIKELEAEVGVDFFHLLPDDVEEDVERSFTIKHWPGI